MWIYVSSDALYHHGIKGQRWGVKNGPPYPLDDSDYSASEKKKGSPKNKSKNGERDFSYAKTSNASVRINKDGSKTFPKGFVFNRVGKASTDINKSGGLYVSYGKEDAARYVKNLGPSALGKLLNTKAETLQHLTVKEPIKMVSDTELTKGISKVLLKDKGVFDSFNESIYSMAYTNDLDKEITREDVINALNYPNKKESRVLAYSVNSFFGDSNYKDETMAIYKHFRDQGYDAIPDIHDSLTGTSKTAMIIINPEKVSISSTTAITKDVMRDAKKYVKSMGKLPIDDILK